VLSNTASNTLSSSMSKLLQKELRRKSNSHLNDESSSSVCWITKKFSFQKKKCLNTYKRNGQPPNKSNNNKSIKKVKYVNCNQFGHFARNCRNPKTKKKSTGHKLNIASEEPPPLFIAPLLNTSNEKDNLYLDLGASRHIIPNRH
jgi:CRISPR/Cas system CSM-associated protein Csm4 (group 5 of RAMP superfamily)